MERLKGLKCRECGRYYPSAPVHVCEFCFGPLEVDYDYEVIRSVISRKRIESGPPSIWRYADLLPLDLPEGTRLMVTAPMVQSRKGEHRDVFAEAKRSGFARARVDGELRDLSEPIVLDKKFKHDIEIVVDRLVIAPDLRSRLTDSLEQSAKLSDGLILLIPADPPGAGADAQDGDLVAVEVTPQRGRLGLATARVTEKLGSLKSERAVSLIAINAHGIPNVFPSTALREAEARR